jgi:hypothetical protein
MWGSLARAAELPTQIDLRAAYCLVILQDDYGATLLAVMRAMDAKDQGRTVPLMTDKTTNQANLRRLQRYLLPRRPYLDPAGLLASTQQGKEDIARLKAHRERCSTSCAAEWRNDLMMETACMMGCQIDASTNPTVARIRVCEDPSWLPF